VKAPAPCPAHIRRSPEKFGSARPARNSDDVVGVRPLDRAESTQMADVAEARKSPTATLLAEISRTKLVMLGLADAGGEMRPMVPHVDDAQSLIYFFTRTSGSLTAKVGLGATGQIVVIGKDHDFYAWLEGAIVQTTERATIDRLWSPSIAAWYKEGKEDPDLSLLMFTPRAGKIWVASDSALLFAWQMAKAFATGDEPDVFAAISVEF
jgi:general stress protein 26